MLKWFKPGRNDIKIYTSDNDGYEPDFVIETASEKLLLETKRADEIPDADVQQKARAAVKWCECATQHAKENQGKSWRYVLVPHDAVKPSATLAGLMAQFSLS